MGNHHSVIPARSRFFLPPTHKHTPSLSFFPVKSRPTSVLRRKANINMANNKPPSIHPLLQSTICLCSLTWRLYTVRFPIHSLTRLQHGVFHSSLSLCSRSAPSVTHRRRSLFPPRSLLLTRGEGDEVGRLAPRKRSSSRVTLTKRPPTQSELSERPAGGSKFSSGALAPAAPHMCVQFKHIDTRPLFFFSSSASFSSLCLSRAPSARGICHA